MSMEWNPATVQKRLLTALRGSMRRINRSSCLTGLLLVAGLSSGCTNLTQPLSGVPARRLPPQFLTQSKSNLVPLDPSRLKQEEPRQYLIDQGDILGIYIQGILPFTKADQPEEPPPVNFPEKESTLDPSIGYPILVQEDGTISLPSIEPLKVKGMTVSQIRDLIRKAYIDAKIFPDVSVLQPSVTIMKERTFDIVVVRQDVNVQAQQMMNQFGPRGTFFRGSDQSSSGQVVKLPAYQNDVLHALMASGGLPGLSARNEVKILKASRVRQQERDSFIQQFYSTYYSNPNPCSCPPPLPDDPSVVKIPMRLPPGVIPSFRPEDILLEDGDVVYIESRDAEVFYTGGLLPGGEFLIPRDYDLDVLGAMAMAGAGVGAQVGRGGGGGFGAGSFGGVAPGMLFILRKTPCNGQITIEVDLARATQDPRERPLIQPGDTLILRHKPIEEVVNFAIPTFFTFGIQAILQQR
ncbi:MAG: polysaccharide biosynthesis/export family protein [Pirellula sp.]|nr:polysaccharide biosynthesis/export family protein [Pirellula sp.]